MYGTKNAENLENNYILNRSFWIPHSPSMYYSVQELVCNQYFEIWLTYFVIHLWTFYCLQKSIKKDKRDDWSWRYSINGGKIGLYEENQVIEITLENTLSIIRIN